MSPGERHSDPDACGGNAAPYVLGALTDDESVAFRRHMDSCTICREEVAALQVAAAALPAAAPQLAVPGDLKLRVMASVREDARRRAPSQSARASRRAASRTAGLRPVLAALAVAAAVVLLAVGVLGGGGASRGARVIRAEVHAPRATALLRLQDGHGELVIAGLPQSARDRVYQVWVKGSGAPQPTDALFTVSSSGEATVGVPGLVDGVKEVMVTSEPRGGSRVPTRAPVIVARLS
jgi:anti-sigma-K factor RskA